MCAVLQQQTLSKSLSLHTPCVQCATKPRNVSKKIVNCPICFVDVFFCIVMTCLFFFKELYFMHVFFAKYM